MQRKIAGLEAGSAYFLKLTAIITLDNGEPLFAFIFVRAGVLQKKQVYNA